MFCLARIVNLSARPLINFNAKNINKKGHYYGANTRIYLSVSVINSSMYEYLKKII